MDTSLGSKQAQPAVELLWSEHDGSYRHETPGCVHRLKRALCREFLEHSKRDGRRPARPIGSAMKPAGKLDLGDRPGADGGEKSFWIMRQRLPDGSQKRQTSGVQTLPALTAA